MPSVDQLVRLLGAGTPRPLALRVARDLVVRTRARVLAGELDEDAVAAMFADGGAVALAEGCARASRVRHRRVFNATGIVLHTGLGRAPLCDAARRAVVEAAGYAVVEVDPVTGERDQRELAVAGLLRDITLAGGALVVNNNAAATTLMLAALCSGREVVVSRGELVEIGGGFRVPDVLARAGARMVEVGCTNKTHLRDYEAAIGENTAALLKIHPSNFRIEGFAGRPSLAEICGLARARGLLALEDLGSGMLSEAPLPCLAGEPRVGDSLREGADALTFSGDKLLGGPQCGILLGREDLVRSARAHPLYRAFRCDKLTLAALEATLRVYRDGDPLADVPVLRMLSASADEIERYCRALAAALPRADARVVESESFAGSGANPARPIESRAVAIPRARVALEALRSVEPIGVHARIAEDLVLLDGRTLLLEDPGSVASAVRAAMEE
ncbi:MAG: L-seryl-tRNA(Sec) selenium transferase [Planctomycetota bacterium]